MSRFNVGSINYLRAMLHAKSVAPAFPHYTLIKKARDALTHRRLHRHLHLSVGSARPDHRLDLSVGSQHFPVAVIIRTARDLATLELVNVLPVI